MTAPDPHSSNTGQNHIAKRAPSRHVDVLWQMFDELRDNIDPAMSTLPVIISVVHERWDSCTKRAAANRAPVRYWRKLHDHRHGVPRTELGERAWRRLRQQQSSAGDRQDATAGAELAASNAYITLVPGDVSLERDCRASRRATPSSLAMDGLSGLVNNAGMSKRISFASASQADWDEVRRSMHAALFFSRVMPWMACARAGARSSISQALPERPVRKGLPSIARRRLRSSE